MQAKTLKMKRHKRLFPRSLASDYIPTGKPPNMLVMRELKERSRSLAFDDEYIDYLVKRRLMDAQGQHISEGRRQISAHIQRIKDLAPALMNVALCNSSVQKTLLFYNEERTRFVIYEENHTTKIIQTSMTYMDRKRCIDAWQAGTIRWVRFSSTSPTN